MKLEILDPLPPPVDARTAPAERLARRVWRTFGRQCIPVAEMPHAHLLNMPGFVRARIRNVESLYAWPSSERYRVIHARWHAWLVIFEEEIARRAPGELWMAGYPPPKESILVALDAANRKRISDDARRVIGRHIVEAELDL